MQIDPLTRVEQGREEEHGFKPFTHHGEEGEQGQAKQVATIERRVDARRHGPHLGLGLLLHPDGHVAQHQGGKNQDPRHQEVVVALALELAHHHLEQKGHHQRGDEPKPDPQIDERVVAARPQLGEVGEADAHQQKGFQPLAQGNEKTCKHQVWGSVTDMLGVGCKVSCSRLSCTMGGSGKLGSAARTASLTHLG